MRALVSLLALSAACAGCDPTVFDRIRDRAPTVVLTPNAGDTQTFGLQVVAIDGELGGRRVSRVLASSGVGKAVRAYILWDGARVDFVNAAFTMCDGAGGGSCDPGAGAAIAGLPSWRGMALCGVVSSPDMGKLYVRCEPSNLLETLTGPPSEQFGASLAALPQGHPLGALLVGAPVNAGRVYRVPDGQGAIAIDLSAGLTSNTRGLGSALAVAPVGTTGALLAAGATLGTQRRVVIASTEGTVATVRACLDAPAGFNGFGGVLAVGDLTGDGAPEVVVSADASLMGRSDEVLVYPGTGLPMPSAGACPAWGAPPQRVRCLDGVGGVVCGDPSGFGSSLAIGDVNGDSLADLVIGAPRASVRAQAAAGALFVVPGDGDEPDPARAVALTLSSPASQSLLGMSAALVTTANGARREPVAGIPGKGSVAVFLCSGLPGDVPDGGTNRCLP